MYQVDHNFRQVGLFSARLGAVTVVLLVFGLLLSARALAAFEQVGTFAGSATPVLEEHFSEEVQLGGVAGLAVNYTGAGGVPAGTVYAMTQGGVAMFEPSASGGLTFRERWPVYPEEVEVERCGPAGELPDGELVHPNCAPEVTSDVVNQDVEVDQTTGNVYARLAHPSPGEPVIVEYKPDGSKAITRFGEQAEERKTVAEGPDKIHEDLAYPGSMAVNGAGEVYVFDETQSPSFYHRLMVFKPQNPGDYEHYVYAGEIAAGSGFGGQLPTRPVTDAAGNVYVGGGTGEKVIEEYAPETPMAYPGSPSHAVCRFEYAPGEIESITVDPVSGAVFFYSNKLPIRVRRLGPCDPGTGKFTELEPEPEALTVTPERSELTGLAFDPVRKLSPSREAGVLYGGANGPVPGHGKGEPHQSSLGYIFAKVEENPPAVEAESVSGVTATSADLHAKIDPMGFKTHYVFQYMTEVAYVEGGESFSGALEVPVGGGVLEPTDGVQSVAVSVTGLVTGTAYRYRVVASSACAPKEPGKACEGVGSSQSFSTFSTEAGGLPDGRVYELVSPIDKNGGEVIPAEPGVSSCRVSTECKPRGAAFPMQSTPDGEAIVYEGTAFSPSKGGVAENEYVSRRSPSGWQTSDPTPSELFSRSGGRYDAFSVELGQGILSQPSPVLSPEAPQGYANLYAQSSIDPSVVVPLVASEPPNRPASGTGSFTIGYAGASADGSRVFFTANDALTEAGAFAPAAVDGGPGENNLYEWSAGQLRLVNVKPGNTETEAGASIGSSSPDVHAVSVDGSRVFWSSLSGQVYVRENGERTVEVPDHTGRFLSASADGSKALLTDGDLYDLETNTVSDLTNGEGGFQGVLGQSEDLSRVYFVDTSVLDETPDEHGEVAKAGQDNLYAWHEGGVRFVAMLVAKDDEAGSAFGSDWTTVPSERTAQASPGGGWVAFVSFARLTGYDNTGPCEADNHGFVNAPCPEVFLYDAGTGGLMCASCDRSGAPPLGSSVLRVMVGSRPQARYLNDQGRLFFDSRNSLVPADVNEGVEDVYEYEPGGVGSCTRQDGCVSLISAGTGSGDSNFLAADASGKNVFFTTRDRLVPTDEDDLVDLYDARENGGFPPESEVTRVACHDEACPGGGGASGSGLLASAVFNGPGDLVPVLPGVLEPKQKVVAVSNGEKLARALKACHRLGKKVKRKRCEVAARKRYGATKKAKSTRRVEPKKASKGGKGS